MNPQNSIGRTTLRLRDGCSFRAECSFDSFFIIMRGITVKSANDQWKKQAIRLKISADKISLKKEKWLVRCDKTIWQIRQVVNK